MSLVMLFGLGMLVIAMPTLAILQTARQPMVTDTAVAIVGSMIGGLLLSRQITSVPYDPAGQAPPTGCWGSGAAAALLTSSRLPRVFARISGRRCVDRSGSVPLPVRPQWSGRNAGVPDGRCRHESAARRDQEDLLVAWHL
jgi:hypothetical protein